MTFRRVAFSSIRVWSFLALAVVLGLGVIAMVRSVQAQQIQRTVFGVIQVPVGHTVFYSIVNPSAGPAGVRLTLLNADTLAVLATSGFVRLEPTAHAQLVLQTISNGFKMIVAAEYAGQERTVDTLRATLQVFNSSTGAIEMGQTDMRLK